MSSKILFRIWPYLAIITAHLIWGGNLIAVKITLQEIPVITLAFLRFSLAFLLLLPFLILQKKFIKFSLSDLPWLVTSGIFMVTLHIAFFFTGLKYTSVTAASILFLIIPILSVIIGWRFFKEKIYLVNLTGIILGLIGAVLVIGMPFAILGVSTWSSSALIGNALIVLSSISWVIGIVISKRIRHKYSSLNITALIFLTGILTFFIPTLLEYWQNPSWVTNVSYLALFGLFYMAAASSVTAYFLFELGLLKLGVIKTDYFRYIEPVIAIPLAILLLGEGIRFSFIIGGILIGLGIYWATLGQPQHRQIKAHKG